MSELLTHLIVSLLAIQMAVGHALVMEAIGTIILPWKAVAVIG